MRDEHRVPRLLGIALIAVGLILLMSVGVIALQEQLRRREVLARFGAVQAASMPGLSPGTPATAGSGRVQDIESSISPTPTRHRATAPAVDQGMPTSPAPTATVATFTPTPSATPLPPTPMATSTATPVPVPIVRIMAPSIELDAPVVEVGWELSEVDGQEQLVWEIADFAAGHHKNSATPGQDGNIVISGHHNIEGEVFRYLVDLAAGDEIILETADGRKWRYRVVNQVIVAEADASPEERVAHARYIAPSKGERLTLVTCWPYWTNTHRLIVIAVPDVVRGLLP